MVRLKFIIAVNILFQAFTASAHSQAFITDAGAALRTAEFLGPFTQYAGKAIRHRFSGMRRKLLFAPLAMSRTSVNGSTILSDGNRATGYALRAVWKSFNSINIS